MSEEGREVVRCDSWLSKLNVMNGERPTMVTVEDRLVEKHPLYAYRRKSRLGLVKYMNETKAPIRFTVQHLEPQPCPRSSSGIRDGRLRRGANVATQLLQLADDAAAR